MHVWHRHFKPSYIRPNGLAVIHDADIPYPSTYKSDPSQRSTIILPPDARGGDHIHRKREELFVGLGKDLTLYIEDPKTRKQARYDMDTSAETGLCTVFHIPIEVAHAVHNHGSSPAMLIEFATRAQEKESYIISYQTSTT